MFHTHKKNILKRMVGLSLLACLAFIALSFTGPIVALAAGLSSEDPNLTSWHAYPSPLPVDLLSAGNFAILAETGITNTGSHACVITGNIGNSPGTAAQMNGVWCSELTGTIYGVDAAYVGDGIDTTCFAGNPPLANKTYVDTAVLIDMIAAYNYAAGVPGPNATELGGGNISGMTLAPGLYKWSTGVLINTDVYLSGGANDVWIFQIAGDLSIASGGSVPAGIKVVLIGGALASNIFWQVGGPTGATLGTYSTFNGNILSAKQVILQTGAVLNGRALAQTQVVLDANVVKAPAAIGPGAVAPEVSKNFNPVTINAGGTSTLTIILSNSSTDTPDTNVTLTDNLPGGVVIAALPSATNNCGGSLTATAGTSTIVLNNGTIPVSSGIIPGTCTVTVRVTAAAAGSYDNIIYPGDVTSNQGPNADPAPATLTVTAAVVVRPTLSKTFNPAIIVSGRGGNISGVSTLTITLRNPNSTVATLTASLIDALPRGIIIANPSYASTTCSGTGSVSAVPLSSNVTLPVTRSIPANGSCTVTVRVTAICRGTYLNTLPSGALRTSNGSNAAPSSAYLYVR